MSHQIPRERETAHSDDVKAGRRETFGLKLSENCAQGYKGSPRQKTAELQRRPPSSRKVRTVGSLLSGDRCSWGRDPSRLEEDGENSRVAQWLFELFEKLLVFFW